MKRKEEIERVDEYMKKGGKVILDKREKLKEGERIENEE